MDAFQLFLAFLALFIAMLVGISLLTSRRQKSVTDFSLAGRELGAPMLASIKMVRGDLHQIWLSAEPRVAQVERQKDELYLSYEETGDALIEFGLRHSINVVIIILSTCADGESDGALKRERASAFRVQRIRTLCKLNL